MRELAKKLRAQFFPEMRATPDGAVQAGAPPPSASRATEFLKTHSISALLPYERFDEHTGVFHNGTDGHGFILECLPLAGANASVAQVAAGLFTQNVPPGTGIQVSLWASPNILPKLAAWADAHVRDAAETPGEPDGTRRPRQNNIFRRMARRRVEYLLRGVRTSLFADKSFLVRDFRLMVSLTFPGESTAHSLAQLLTLRDGTMSTLRAAGIPNRVMDAERFVNVMDEILNPGTSLARRQPLNWDEGRALKHQIVDGATRCLVGKDGLVINDTAVRCYSVRSYPRVWPLWHMADLIGDNFQSTLQIPCPFLFTLGVSVPKQEGIKGTAMTKGARATQNAESRMAKYLPEFTDKKKDWDILLKALDEGHGGVRMYHQIVTFAPVGSADTAEQALRSLYSTKGWELQVDSGVQVQGLIDSLPLTLSKGLAYELEGLGRFTTKTTRNAGNMMPVIGEWCGTGTPTLLLLGTRGQIQYVDIFDKMGQGGNFNAAVAARSGSGKSFLMNEMAKAYLARGGRVWIIDVGRSYERICKMVGGQFVEFNDQSRICLNPFTHMNDAITEEFAEQVAELKPIVALMAAPSRKTDDLENAWIEQAINHAWAARRNLATITDLAAWLMQHEHPRAKELGQMLFPYTRDGVHGRFFEGAANLDFKNDFIVLELEELKSKPDLQSVVMLTVMARINQAVYLGRGDGRRKLLMIDEAWDLFGDGESSGKFIEVAARRIRKYGGSLITATQGINDYYATPAALAAFENSDWLLLLAQKKESIEQLERSGRLTMDAHMKRQLTTLTTVMNQYSDLMLIGPQGCSVSKLIVDPYSALAYSTTNEDFVRFKALEAQGLSSGDAMDRLYAERSAS